MRGTNRTVGAIHAVDSLNKGGVALLLLFLAASVAPIDTSVADRAQEILDSKTDWSEQDRVNAEQLAKARASLWGYCLGVTRKRFSRSRERAEIVATAIVASCQSDEDKYRAALITSFRGVMEPGARRTMADQIVSKQRKDSYEATIAQLVAARLPRR